MRYTLSLLISLLLLSCFHKDVMKDSADDVAAVFFYSGTEGKYIITKEQIFQAQSKESGGGVTNISGYAEYRITSYDLLTGNQTGRVNLGEGIEKAFCILGSTPGKLWLYSIDPGIGFHCRNPKTLELISDEKALTASGPLKGFSFARPEWMKLKGSYGINIENGKLMLSDMQGFHYYFDVEKSTLEKTGDGLIDYDWAVTKTGSTGYFSKKDYVSLNANGRQKLQYGNEDSTGKFSYLNGEIILDVNPVHDLARKNEALAIIGGREKTLKDSIASLTKILPATNGSFTSFAYKVKNGINSMEREIDNLEREKTAINRKNSKYFDNAVLSDAPGNLFIIHGTDVSDTSRMQVTKVNLNGKIFTETWTVKLPQFYRDPGKANSKGAFETVFSDGNPSFSYQWFGLPEDKLIIISQLRIICIDVNSGKTTWEHPL
ncbi:hypothetical protein BH11BAC7_BH11BAC7_10920 [soil metagenome]